MAGSEHFLNSIDEPVAIFGSVENQNARAAPKKVIALSDHHTTDSSQWTCALVRA